MGESIASEGKGEYMYVEGRVLSTDGTPVANATIDTWETDSNGERRRGWRAVRVLTGRLQDRTTRSTACATSPTAGAACRRGRTAGTATAPSCLCRTPSPAT